MKNLFYAALAIGVIALGAGIYMYAGMGFHGKAFATIGLGVLCLIAGIAGMVMKPNVTTR